MPNDFDRARLDTVQIVPPTPFSADGRALNPGPLADLVRALASRGARVFLPAAGTGEFHSLGREEVLACVATAREAAGPGATIIAPIGFGLHESIAMGREALRAGADALLLMPPIHPYLSDDGVREYFRALAQGVGAPILTYKRGPTPSDKLLVELARSGDLIGVKYAVNDLDAVARFVEAVAGNCGVYCGTAERFAPYFALAGATGYTSGTGCLAPALTLALHRALGDARYAEAMPLARALRPMEDFRARGGDSLNISALKQALALLGRDFGPVRPPQRGLTRVEAADLRAVVEALTEAEGRFVAEDEALR